MPAAAPAGSCPACGNGAAIAIQLFNRLQHRWIAYRKIRRSEQYSKPALAIEPDELLFHLWLGQPFLCNAGLQFLPLFFQSFQPLFPHCLFIAGLFLLGSSTLVVGIHFPGVADTAFSEHQCTALAAVQLGGEQIAFLCLMTGRGLFIFRQLFLHLVEQVRVCAAKRSNESPSGAFKR